MGVSPDELGPLEGLDRFEIQHTLGAGGMGVVYRAHDKVRRIDVALKLLRRADGGLLGMFKNEFRSLADVVHRNLVTLYELQSSRDVWFFTMELVHGVSFLEYARPYRASLAQALRRDTVTSLTTDRWTASGHNPTEETLTSAGTTPWVSGGPKEEYANARRASIESAQIRQGRIRPTVAQLIEGVHALHRAGKMHRDLKHSNVIVEATGRVVVCDFGLVAEMKRDATSHLHAEGTPNFMSPEQAAGLPLTSASDWYSVGVMLYHALTGHLPFEGNRDEVMRLKQASRPPPPRHWVQTIDEDLNALCVALLRPDPDERPSAPQILAALSRTPISVHEPRGAPLPSVPLVGRGTHMAELRDALAASRHGQSVVVYLHGRSGVGKTALLRQFLDELNAAGEAVVLVGRCYERESVPYKALDALVDALAAHLDSLPVTEARELLPKDLGALSRLFPVIGQTRCATALAGDPEDEADVQTLRKRAFGALRAILEAVAHRRPTVLAIDDLHWGDRDSAPFLTELIHGAKTPSILLIASYRTAEADTSTLLRELLRPAELSAVAGDVREMELEPLTTEESQLLAAALLGVRDSGIAKRANEIAREARGNPFFIVEMSQGGAHGAPTAQLSLDAVLGDRIGELSEDARQLLLTSAIAGGPVPMSIVGRASGVKDEPSALAKLRAEHLVRTRTDGASEDVEPYHDRIRETALATLSGKDTRRFHRRLARAFESAERRRHLPALVEHWLGAGDSEKAVRYAEAAAEEAERTLAFAQAAHYWGIVLELGDLAAEQRRWVQVQRADALAHSGSLVQAANQYLSAAEGAHGHTGLELRRRALEQLLRSGRVEDARELAQSVLREVGLRLPGSHRRALAQVVLHRAWLAVRGLEYRRRLIPKADPEELVRIDVCWTMSTGLNFVDPMIAKAFQMRHLSHCLRVGDRRRLAMALACEVGFRSFAGSKTRARVADLAASTTLLAKELGHSGILGFSVAIDALSLFLSGEFAEAHERMLEGERLMADHPDDFRWEIDLCGIYRMAALLYLGEIRRMTVETMTLLRDARERGDEYLATALRCGRTNVAWLMLGDPEEARRQLGEASLPDQGFHLPHYFQMLNHCQIDLYLGDGIVAYERVETSWRSLKKAMLLRIQSVRIEALFLRARCALAAAAQGPSPQRYQADVERAARALAKEHTPWATASAETARALLALQRDADDAIPKLRSAHEALQSLGLGLLATAVYHRLGQRIGGTRGEEILEETRQMMRRERIHDPEAIVAVYAPCLSPPR